MAREKWTEDYIEEQKTLAIFLIETNMGSTHEIPPDDELWDTLMLWVDEYEEKDNE